MFMAVFSQMLWGIFCLFVLACAESSFLHGLSLVAVSGVFFIVVCGLLIVMPSLIAEHGLQ